MIAHLKKASEVRPQVFMVHFVQDFHYEPGIQSGEYIKFKLRLLDNTDLCDVEWIDTRDFSAKVKTLIVSQGADKKCKLDLASFCPKSGLAWLQRKGAMIQHVKSFAGNPFSMRSHAHFVRADWAEAVLETIRAYKVVSVRKESDGPHVRPIWGTGWNNETVSLAEAELSWF